VVGNGVDTSYYSAPDTNAVGAGIIFFGLMNYHPNIEAVVSFTRTICPKLREKLPYCRLTLVGANPVEEVLALRQEAGVEVTGTVPDVRPYCNDALSSVVPLRTGGSTRLTILEAMAAGVPIVSSPMGAEGLMVEDGRDILLANPNDSNEWLQALVLLSHDGARRRRLTAAARDVVREHCDWTVVGRSLWRHCQVWSQTAE
jgi:glycosyltransferase involved in cell wall biosynthesis